MPTCRRKRVLLTQPSQLLLNALKTDPHKEVYYLAQTGEVFETYEAYAARMSFYRLKQFQCEVTGKSGLDYFQALESEQQEARTMHSRFPEPLKAAVLKSVQWQVIGRLDHLVDAVFDRFKDRYFPDERVFVDIQGDKYYARVVQVFPPRSSIVISVNSNRQASSSSSTISDEDTVPIHKVAEDLKIPLADSIARDDPNKYYYKIQILEEDKGNKSTGVTKGKETSKTSKYSGSLMDVRCADLSRDRLSFSKSILRRFIRECVEREAAVASPWVVKSVIATRYGVDTVMSEETRISVEVLKKGESDKRKKAWEDKEGPPSKKQKKIVVVEDDKSNQEQRDKEEQEKAEKAQKVKEESERLAAEKKKKKPVRYPTEDLDIQIGDKEKKAGMKVRKPAPSRTAMPFGTDHETNEAFLMAWNFLVVYGNPLHLSTFTLDEFEGAIRHSHPDAPCPLISEVHSTLIYNLRTVPFTRHSAIISLFNSLEEADVETFGISTSALIDASRDIGNNWERAPLRHAEGREGWEESLIGCLKDHANLENFPHLREIFIRLLYAPEALEEAAVASGSKAPTPVVTPNPERYTTRASPKERYHLLSPKDKTTILFFMCNLAVSSKAIHTHMETCEEQLTELRKQKIEVNRSKKQHLEDIATLTGESKDSEKTNDKKSNGGGEDTPMHDSSDLSEAPGSDGETENGSAAPSGRQSVRRAQAKERELARAKLASQKQALAETRRLDEEVNKCERRLEQIERDFRKLLGAVRVKPLGRDRFYNRVWWFDGMGSALLIGNGGSVQYGTGRIFVQGPSEHDVEILQRREEDIPTRRVEEEGEEGMLRVGEWAVYEEIETIDEFVAWLNPKGVRELALKNAITKWWSHIGPGIRKRQADLAQLVNTRTQESSSSRRSARQKHSGSDVSREPYMMWTNRRAVNAA
ncbi:chromatin remodeling complex protein [Irpex rosettiformis]|uniref:Chromatin remodeling complex protein n=1 Tax=Irpex rosettiformis TaxID=378272 RepID=A0ACB8UK32_9APHY|nr:chromatin remodeling complex protein [Irpex rosettiformis]